MSVSVILDGVRAVQVNGTTFYFAPEQPLRYVYYRGDLLIRSCQPPVVSEWETSVIAYLYHSWRHWYRNIRRWNRGQWGANFRSWFSAPGTARA